MTRTSTLRSVAAVLAAGALLLAACSSDSDSDAGSSSTTAAQSGGSGYEGALSGTFEIAAAECADGAPTAGSYFRMVQAGGTAADGPFVDNADSACGDTSYSALAPGTDGGLVVGQAQPAPDPAFDASGNATASSIFEPVKFFGVDFAGATSAEEAVPSIEASDGQLSGDLSAFTAYYGGGDFNQGAPKPDGSGDGPTGTIDPESGAYTLEWTSVISGGSFDGFTGVWHLEGTFSPAG